MDLVKKQLEKLQSGDATTMYGLVVWRIGDKHYLVGETINVTKDLGMTIDAAAAKICELANERS